MTHYSKHPLSEIKSLRLSKNWSQEQVATMSGLSTRTIQRIETGSKPDLETLKALSAVFEVDFFTVNDTKNVSTVRSGVTSLLIFTGAFGFSLTLLGLLFRVLYWKGAYIMLVLGVSAIALVFIPMVAMIASKRIRVTSNQEAT